MEGRRKGGIVGWKEGGRGTETGTGAGGGKEAGRRKED
jgi:hypothetical protein